MRQMTTETTLVCSSCGTKKTYPKGMEVAKVKANVEAFRAQGSLCTPCVAKGVQPKATVKGEKLFKNVVCTKSRCYNKSETSLTRTQAMHFVCNAHGEAPKPVAKKARATKKAAPKKEVTS